MKLIAPHAPTVHIVRSIYPFRDPDPINHRFKVAHVVPQNAGSGGMHEAALQSLAFVVSGGSIWYVEDQLTGDFAFFEDDT